MDELRDFFNNPCPSSAQTIKIRAPLTGGLRITKNDTINELNRREDHRKTVVESGIDYSRKVKERELNLYMKNEVERLMTDGREFTRNGLDSLEQLSSYGTSTHNIVELTEEAMTQVYSKYSFQMKEDTKNLPIHPFHNKIIDSIQGFGVIIIEGPTGCGKTTQVPQWILDEAYNARKPCKIIVTQPRKIAAISIARRVAQERGWDVGGVVGYQVGLENKTSSDTRIHYVTTGVLLQKLVNSKNMNEYTHVILDEVHERGHEMDFLLLVVRKLLYTVSPKVKVILMSATFNSRNFNDYFSVPTRGPTNTVALDITNEKPTFTVKIFYKDHIGMQFGNMINEQKEPAIKPEDYNLVIKLVDAIERIDEREEAYTDRSTADLPSVLVFLPGIHEIEELYACLMDIELRVKLAGAQCGKFTWWVLPLHSTITADEQVRVFQRAPPGHRKIILATNIAESSITVPDIKYVIDFCVTKVLVADPNTNFTSLQLRWASKTNCEQRAGRAGRVRDGRVYRLVYKTFYESLQQDCEPEITRCPLERLVLLAKMLEMGPPSDVLALAMDPPEMSNINRTILVLKEIGALKKTDDEECQKTDGEITYLGRMMAKLPIDVRSSKLIVLGYIFGCLEECIIMAAGMSVKSVFSSPFRERLNAYNSKLTWADGSTSDCIALLNVYKVWNHLRQQKYFKQQGNNEVQWARRFYVQTRSLKELDDMVRELRMRCSREGIEPLKGNSPWNKHEIPLVLKVILAGAFYPQYFIQATTDEAREREAMRVLGGLDPRNTVYLKGFPDNQPGIIYASAIKKIIKQHIGDEPRVTFDNNSQKVYLTFQDDNQNLKNSNSRDPTIPGQVALPVYKSVKARQLNMNIRLPLLPVEKAEALASAMEALKHSKDINKMVPRLPAIDDTYFRLKISQFVTVGKFWVQYDEEYNLSELNQIQVLLNRKGLLTCTKTITLDMLVAAPYADAESTLMFRARVTKLLPKEMLEVLYIDYGSVGLVGSGSLRELPPGICCDTSPLAMQCTLAGIAPAPLLHAHSQWSPTASRFFCDLISKGRLMGKIYSVTHGIVSIELLVDEGKISVNKELLAKGFAVACEESYDSKLNHDLRQTATELNIAQKRAYNKEQTELAFSQLLDVESPNYKECISDVYLKGPNSPLESCLHNMMYSSRDKQVHVEWNSVNSVVLDTEPQEIYERLLVAAEVGQNEMSSKLTLRHTTLLPNIRGLPAIIALLFSPEAELRRDKENTRYVSVLCGLGCNEDGAPHFAEHDLLVNIDADLSIEDIGSINHIRYLMDYVMFCKNGQEVPSADEDFTLNVPKAIRIDLMQLLLKRRKQREPQTVINAWEWLSIPQEDVLEISDSEMALRSLVFPLHAPLELYPISREKLLALKRDTDELKILVGRAPLSSTDNLECKLCGTPPMPMHAMRIHLCSNSHLEKEEDFRIVQS